MSDPTDIFTHKHTHLLIDGGVGKIEMIVDRPPTLTEKNVAIICHPHPLHGGTLNNKVVTTLSRAFQEIGAFAIRFNYRGVGTSEGSFAKGEGESDDGIKVLEWVQKQFEGYAILSAGFSFGAFVAAHIANQTQVSQLVTIAPSVDRMDFSRFGNIKNPWLLIQGGEDEIVSKDAVLTWREENAASMDLIYLPKASHFFHGQLITLKEKLVNYLKGKQDG